MKRYLSREGIQKRSSDLPRPLDAVEKTKAMSEWSHKDYGLAASDLRVLSVLLNRQNAKNGRCDPGIDRLIADTGLSKRSVESAFSKLQQAGAIVRNLNLDRNRRKWIIQRPNLGPCTEHVLRNPERVEHIEELQVSAPEAASFCGEPPQAPAVIKEKKRKRKSVDVDALTQRVVRHSNTRNPRKEAQKHEAFEKKIISQFEHNGLGYGELLEIPTALLEDIRERWLRKTISGKEAADEMLQHLLDHSTWPERSDR